MNDDVQLSYLAGFFDGEGSIGIDRSHRTLAGGPYVEHTLHVSVNNTYLPVLEMFHERFGGTLRAAKAWANKPMFTWETSSRPAEVFLETIRPYLHEKVPQAWLGLEFIAQRTLIVRQRRAHGYFTSQAPDPAETALRDGFYWALRNAKRAA